MHPLPGDSHFVGWSGLAQSLEMLWKASSPATASAHVATTANPASARTAESAASAAAAPPYSGAEQQLSVICGESPNPDKIAAYIRQAMLSERRAGLGAQVWPWIAYCVDWPVKAASPYLGPWNHHTNPIMVMGNTGDPATPYGNAVLESKLLPGARLVTVKGYGHTELGNVSTCAQNYVAGYLIRGVLPARGDTCNQNSPPFR